MKLEDIQLLLGISSYKTTLRYLNIDDESNKNSANVIQVYLKKTN